MKNFLHRYSLPLRYLLVITTIASSYIFAITFIQLGLPNFGKITLSLDENFVNKTIMFFGLVGGFFAYLGGLTLHKVRNNIHAIILIRTLVIIISIMARSLSLFVFSQAGYFWWVFLMGAISGFGTSFSYSLAYLLLPPKHRGMVGGIITATIYGIGAISLPSSWTLDALLHSSVIVTFLTYSSYLMLLIFILGRPVSQAEVDVNIGTKPYRDYKVKKIFLVLTMVLFIDSFGFLRIVMGTDDFVKLTWQGGFPMLAYIGIVHVISALFFGRVYDKKSPIFIIKVSLILFFIADILFVLLYGIPELQILLAYLFVLFYSPAVSIYTIVYIMIVADMVTKKTMGKTYGLYAAIVGWIASFVSTGVALSLIGAISSKTHLLVAGGLSALAFFVLRAAFKNEDDGKELSPKM